MEVNNVKIALSMIIEENEPVDMVERAISSLQQYVDKIFVTVTYKEKEPKKTPLISLLKKNDVVVSFWKWTHRFDEARNFAASQIPKEYLYYIWTDVDDVWQNPHLLRQLALEAYTYNISAVFFDYWYLVELDETGKVREILVKHKRERLVRNDDSFKWIGRLHETLIEQRQYNVTKIFKPDVVVVHLTNGERSEKNLDRNIEILEEALVEENKKDPRTLMYLGKAYFDRAKMSGNNKEKADEDFALAEDLFAEYLSGSGTPGLDYKGASGWAEERASAWEYLSDIYRIHQKYNSAIKANVNSLIEAPSFPNYYLDMAMNYVLLKDFKKADIWLGLAKTIEVPDTTMIITPRDLKARALEIEYHVAMALQQLERAKTAAERLVKLFPNNQDMLNRLKDTDALLNLNKTAQSIVYVGKYLESSGETERIKNLINAVPTGLQQEHFVSQMRQKFMPPRLWDKDEIAIVCGPGFEGWSPKSLERGIGGSEAAVIYQAKELAKLGYRVTVFADPRSEIGEYDGVFYKPWYELNIKDTFNIMVLWRAIGFVDNNFQARQTYLWMHDVPINPDFTEERLSKIDKIFVLSEYHKSLCGMIKNGRFEKIPDEKFVVTANGAISSTIKEEVKRNPHRLIYTSSYDRGLPHLLVLWPDIKKEVPDAELHIFYGWQTYDAIFRDNPERKMWKAKMQEMMKQDGIVEHGRVSHDELALEYAKSGVFAYPCDFQEISCQNAMAAQIYGAVPVVTNYAALKETVQFGKKVDADITSVDGKREYLQEILAVLKDDKKTEEERQQMIEWAKDKFKWSFVAESWKKLFEENSKNGIVL